MDTHTKLQECLDYIRKIQYVYDHAYDTPTKICRECYCVEGTQHKDNCIINHLLQGCDK